MSIMWRYLDKRSATIAAIKDFNNMKFIIRDTGEEIRGVYENAAGAGSPKLDGMPKAHNPTAGEDRAIKAIEEIDLLRERYRQACEYMAWFQPAWDALSEDDRFVLDTFFCSCNEYGSGAADVVADHFSIERSSAYRKKSRALENLTTLLYGKG